MNKKKFWKSRSLWIMFSNLVLIYGLAFSNVSLRALCEELFRETLCFLNYNFDFLKKEIIRLYKILDIW